MLGALLLAGLGGLPGQLSAARAAGAGTLKVTNLDGGPYDDRLVMSRIQNPETGTGLKADGTCCIPANVVHDTATARLANTGSGPLTVTGLTVSSGWTLPSAPALPLTIAAGSSIDLPVKFVYQGTTGSIFGTLVIASDDASHPSTSIELAGKWQMYSEKGTEPSVQELGRDFGFTTTIVGTGQTISGKGAVKAVGEEVLSPYWTRVDRTKNVTVKQLAAFHTQGNLATINWYSKGTSTLNFITNSAGVEAQTVLPHKNGSTTTYAGGSFSTDNTFGFKVDSEWSDDTLNDATPDLAAGCVAPCGHHMRFYPAYDRSGAIMPNTWLMFMDYSGINYDYNDNFYLISNMRPETATDPTTPDVLPGAAGTALTFDSGVTGTLQDANGVGTGFAATQRNSLDGATATSSYQPSQLHVTGGALRVDATAGSNTGSDNTQVNALQMPFDADAEPFTASARLVGPLSAIDAGSEMAGVMVGRDQDNYVRVAVVGAAGAQKVQLSAESGATATVVATSGTLATGLDDLDLYLVGDPASGSYSAAYRTVIAGVPGAITKLSGSYKPPATSVGRWFSRHSNAGILTSAKGGTTFTASYDSFTLAPEDSTVAQRAPIARIDVGNTGSFTDSQGRVWSPDTGLFTPSTAIAEGATTTPLEIANTTDDVLYRTYRGNTNTSTQSNRVISFAVPTGTATNATVRLLFAERSGGNNGPAKRVFSISAEGTVVRGDFDIFAAAGGINSAITLTLPNVKLSGGKLDLVLAAGRDYPAISGIEVLSGPGDTTAPVPPGNVSATPAADGTVKIAWSANTESDLAGYQVYRSTSTPVPTTGTPLSGASLLTGTSFTDSSAQPGTTYFYVVTAVDNSGNVSASSQTVDALVGANGFTARVNFQDPATTPPSGYLRDSGEPYGARTAADQGSGMTYGWVANGTSTPLDLTLNGRNRTGSSGVTDTDLRLLTFLHMQYPTASSGTGGTTTPGAWEIAVPNGSYTVTVVVGDAGTALDSKDTINIEGVNAINQFVPTSAARHASATRTVTVGDGRLTLDPTGGVNTKIDYVTVASAAVDNTPPAAPTGLAAVVAADGNSVALTWNANTETDLAGYRVYRSQTQPVSTSGTPRSGSSLLTVPRYTDSSVSASTTYFYAVVAVDSAGNQSAASASVQATIPARSGPYTTKVNFQDAATSVPTGYLRDSGEPYALRTGADQGTMLSYGWVRNGTHTPLDLTLNGRARTGTPSTDVRLRTFVMMQYPTYASQTAGTSTPGAWELSLPNGTYTVTVAVGDDSTVYDSSDTINVEGTSFIASFVPTSGVRHMTVTKTVVVGDGLLTVDPTGGQNTKIDYIDVVGASTDTTPPAAPTGVTAAVAPSGSSVQVAWSPNGESDLAGYEVFRSKTLPVPTTGTPVSGAGLLTTTSFADGTVDPDTTYSYVVVAVDTSGNAGAASAAATVVTPPAGPAFNLKVNFQDTATTVPAGYVRDSGDPYGPRSGPNQGSGLTYGWERNGTTTPLDLTLNPRVRTTGTTSTDVRLLTFIHMQYPSTLSQTAGTSTPGMWEVAVPNGTYVVTVAVGDDGTATDSKHQINIEDQNAVAQFVPTSSNRHRTATRTVHVADGRLTLSPTGGTNTKLDYVDIASLAGASGRPRVSAANPANLGTAAPTDVSVTADLELTAAGGLDDATVTASNVKLSRVSDDTGVPVTVNTSGGGDDVVLTPTTLLDANTTYRFDITAGVTDIAGNAIQPWSSVFTTGAGSIGTGLTGVAFTKSATIATGHSYTSLVVGPDHQLYAGSLDGFIYRFPIAANGDLGTPTVITTVRDLNGGVARTVIGMAFTPDSTATNLTMWVTDNAPYVGVDNVADWQGKVDKLSGPNLGTGQTVVVGLPRSVRDHETNSLAFGPDGAIYIAQGSDTAFGAPDSAWGNRPEHVLNAAILRLDRAKLPATLPLNVQTEDGGTYNPYASGAALTLYATGVRNAFDLVWHSNGSLYAPTNGSAANGNVPATPATLPSSCAARIDSSTNGPWTGPATPALTPNPNPEPDWIFNVHPGGYYGHPDPARCEWSLNGGNPTSAADPFETTAYPVGTAPDRNYRFADVYDTGLHASADGAIEYKSNTFNGALKGKLLVVRYSAGQDVMVVDPSGPGGKILSRATGVTGLSGFNQPLDITEDTTNGTLYVSELGASDIVRLSPS